MFYHLFFVVFDPNHSKNSFSPICHALVCFYIFEHTIFFGWNVHPTLDFLACSNFSFKIQLNPYFFWKVFLYLLICFFVYTSCLYSSSLGNFGRSRLSISYIKHLAQFCLLGDQKCL